MSVRQCGSNDHEDVLALLKAQQDDPVAVLIQNNLLQTGGIVDYEEQPFHGHYYGLFRDGNLIGVAAHYWNGTVMLVWPVEDNESIDGLVFEGPVKRIESCQSAVIERLLGQFDAAQIQSKTVYALTGLDSAFPLEPDYFVDRAREHDQELIASWRVQFLTESYGPGDDHMQVAEQYVRDMLPSIRVLVGKEDEVAMAMLAYNALIPEQAAVIGSLFVPAEDRGRGLATQLLRGCLNSLRGDSVRSVLLYTRNPIAQHLYASHGFKPTGKITILSILN